MERKGYDIILLTIIMKGKKVYFTSLSRQMRISDYLFEAVQKTSKLSARIFF
jgi:hypothetical protein